MDRELRGFLNNHLFLFVFMLILSKLKITNSIAVALAIIIVVFLVNVYFQALIQDEIVLLSECPKITY